MPNDQQRYNNLYSFKQQEQSIFPAFSHCSLVDSSHCQLPANRNFFSS